jgi:hypothetical protein
MDHYDVFQSAKSVRRSRPELLCNVEEYKFCYDLVKEKVKMSQEEQSNAKLTTPTDVLLIQ